MKYLNRIGFALVICFVLILGVKSVVAKNKKKPKKQGRFARKMAEMMEKAEEQKRLQEEAKRKQKRK